jgi:SAM-dependent methyltransferase
MKKLEPNLVDSPKIEISTKINRHLHFFPSWNSVWRKVFRAVYLMLTDPKYLIHKLRLSLVRHRMSFPSVCNRENPFGEGHPERVLIFPESKLAHKYCVGNGLEIGGSAHNPFGLDTLNVDLSDSMNTIFKQEEVALCGRALPVDIIANGDNIPLPDASQNFVVSSHVIEHFPNPIKALLEWDRLIRPDGIIFMIVPHKDRTFDKGKESTSLEHLIEDHINSNTQPHNNSEGHDHCWTTQEFEELIHYIMNELGVHWKIIEVRDVDDKVGNGFIVVIQKLGMRQG